MLTLNSFQGASMVYLQFILSLLPFTSPSWLETLNYTPSQQQQVVQSDLRSPSVQSNITKSIAIVGAGSAGLAVLKTLLDLPENVRSNWRIVCYEQRHDVGGVWLPDLSPPSPPTLPETPLYPLLRTNTPHPTMTYPGFPFPPNTPLFPSWDYVEQYHVAFTKRFNLTNHIHLNHEIVAAGWHGNHVAGKWELEVIRTDLSSHASEHEFFDHLIVANGHNHYPRIPRWDGQYGWLQNTPAGTPKREILHSIFYREPERYANRTVVIVGGGASGRDAALQIGPLATVSKIE
jgi:cation diffusion facilitator CzcD-associated flavoprotein CzcO